MITFVNFRYGWPCYTDIDTSVLQVKFTIVDKMNMYGTSSSEIKSPAFFASVEQNDIMLCVCACVRACVLHRNPNVRVFFKLIFKLKCQNKRLSGLFKLIEVTW